MVMPWPTNEELAAALYRMTPPMGPGVTHSLSCWQWHQTCAIFLAADWLNGFPLGDTGSNQDTPRQ